jgi:hypothetical protein
MITVEFFFEFTVEIAYELENEYGSNMGIGRKQKSMYVNSLIF